MALKVTVMRGQQGSRTDSRPLRATQPTRKPSTTAKASLTPAAPTLKVTCRVTAAVKFIPALRPVTAKPAISISLTKPLSVSSARLAPSNLKTASEVNSLNTSALSGVISPPLSLNSSKTDIRKSAVAKRNAIRDSQSFASHALLTAKSAKSSPKAQTERIAIEDIKLPMSGANVCKLLRNQLSVFELSEIEGEKEVYFLGVVGKRGKVTGSEAAGLGLDDEKGDYRVTLHDHIAYRYEILEMIGKGSFGQVLLVRDHKLHSESALKIIKNKPSLLDQAQREIQILRHIAERDHYDSYNIVRLKETFVFRGHVCMAFEVLGENLYEVLKRNAFQGLGDAMIRKVAGQVLVCLKAIHRMNVIHCDLKPENILYRSCKASLLKVIDFGSSCYANTPTNSYIQSMYYRAPEVILGLPYSPSVDIWSLGCLLAELHAGLPLFPGETELELLHCISEIIGLPPKNMLGDASKSKLFFDAKGGLKSIPMRSEKNPNGKSMKEALKNADETFLNFIESETYTGCLQWDPKQRITAEDALCHAWLKPRSAHKAKSHRHSLSNPDYRLLQKLAHSRSSALTLFS